VPGGKITKKGGRERLQWSYGNGEAHRGVGKAGVTSHLGRGRVKRIRGKESFRGKTPTNTWEKREFSFAIRRSPLATLLQGVVVKKEGGNKTERS